MEPKVHVAGLETEADRTKVQRRGHLQGFGARGRIRGVLAAREDQLITPFDAALARDIG